MGKGIQPVTPAALARALLRLGKLSILSPPLALLALALQPQQGFLEGRRGLASHCLLQGYKRRWEALP